MLVATISSWGELERESHYETPPRACIDRSETLSTGWGGRFLLFHDAVIDRPNAARFIIHTSLYGAILYSFSSNINRRIRRHSSADGAVNRLLSANCLQQRLAPNSFREDITSPRFDSSLLYNLVAICISA